MIKEERLSDFVTLLKYTGLSEDDFFTWDYCDIMKKNLLRDILATLHDLHIKYEYVVAEVKIGPYRQKIELGFHLPDLDSYITLPGGNDVRIVKDENSISVNDFKDAYTKLYKGYKYRTGIDLTRKTL